MTIKIKELEVGGFGNIKKVADTLHITSATVNLMDNGVNVTYHLTGNGEVVYNAGSLNIANEDLSSWIDSDEQLIDVILSKLGLEKAPEEPAAPTEEATPPTEG